MMINQTMETTMSEVMIDQILELKTGIEALGDYCTLLERENKLLRELLRRCKEHMPAESRLLELMKDYV
jgi:hypothetical protein